VSPSAFAEEGKGARGSRPPTDVALPLGATVTIVFSDIRGFTEYTDQYGDEAAYRLLQQHNGAVRNQVDLFGGYVVKTQGDSFMVAFPTARSAIQCAVSVQRVLASAQTGAGTRIALGIGINTGEPIQEGGDFFGSPVNLAARICAAAGPGQIFVSETTRYVTGRIEAVEFVDRGLHDLKGFQEPQRLYEVRSLDEARGAHGAGQDLSAEIAALAERCRSLGAELVEASQALQGTGELPAATLGRQLGALRVAFGGLCSRVFQRAAQAGVNITQSADRIASLAELEPLLEAINQAEAGRVAARERAAGEDDASRQAALEAAVQRAMGVLNRVLAISHPEDPGFQALLECQAKASELRLKLSRVASTNRDYSAHRVDEATKPFADLLALVDGQDDVDDERWMALEESVGRVFGRQLLIAASRGRLVVAGGARRARAQDPAPAAPPRVEPREAPTPSPTYQPAPPRPAAVEVPRAEPIPVETHRAEPVRETRPEPPADQPTGSLLPTLDPRAAGVTWWSAAHREWTAWKSSGMATAHALRAAMSKHPYLLSVPITQSAGYDEGRLAGAYFVLLNHVENVSPSFLRHAVEEALQRAGPGADPAALGPALYELLVSKGRLRQTYADFVRDGMVAAIPIPGVWADAIVTEHEDSTVITTRPSREIGDAAEQSRELTDVAERLSEHRIALTLPALTARFFCIRRGELREARDIVIKLTEGGEPSTAAWALSLRSDQLMAAPPKRCGAEGLSVEGFGKNYSALWLTVFNSDPELDKTYELTASLCPQGVPASTPRRSVFTGRSR
jgi:class 3 adenylate cyclase